MNEEVNQRPWTENAHKVFRYILLGQLALCVLIGFITDTLLLGLLVGVPIVAVPIILTLQYPHHAVSRHAVGIATQLMTALHIQQAFGMTEMHFEVFVMLAFLFFYRDWKVVVSATLVVAVHHVLFFILQGAGMPFIIVEEGRVQFYVLVIHAVFAVAEAAVLAVMAHRSHNEAMAAETLAVSVRKIASNDGLINLADFTPMNTPSLASFNKMMLTVKSLIQEANQVSENLHSVVNKVSLSSNELDQAVDQQDQQVSSIKSAMQNITSSINEVALLSQGANEIADQAKSSTDQTRTALDGSNANISQLKATLETTSAAISDLSAKCSNISEVMQSIKSVAEQTNLLALNAAIESARAGEHGRGFAVVADEVRNLAIKSKESAEEIELITSQLTDSANNSVQNMVNCVSMVELAVESSSEASNNMASVMSSIDSVNQNVTTVAGAATEQAQTSETITVSTEELYGLFVGEKQQVQSLRIDVENLSSLAIQLQTQLKQFKVN